jgi:DNA integrity scanning protein DisA with diadenylate cyclase activity
METASFNGFIKTLFYIILFYYAIKFIARIFLPILVKKAVDKAGENFQNQYNRQQQQQNRPSDNIVVDTSKAAKPRETKKVGEYVDYEEID